MSLSPEEARKLLESHMFRERASHKITLDPLKGPQLKTAFKNRLNTVVINHKLFRIRYVKDTAFVKSAKGAIPCGWYEIDKVLSDE